MIKGCSVLFSDTVFFKKEDNKKEACKVDCYIRNDEEGCLSSYIDNKKMTNLWFPQKLKEVAEGRLNQRREYWAHLKLPSEDKKVDKGINGVPGKTVDGDKEKISQDLLLLRFKPLQDAHAKQNTLDSSNTRSSTNRRTQDLPPSIVVFNSKSRDFTGKTESDEIFKLLDFI